MGRFLRMNSREMIGEFRSLRQGLSGRLDSATLSLLIAESRRKIMRCEAHKNCAITVTQNLFFTVKTDFIDDVRLLILRNLLKAMNWPTNPAYRLARRLWPCVTNRFTRLLRSEGEISLPDAE
jgi:hypothetical protein